MPEEAGPKRRGWLTILLGVAALLGLGFALYALALSWQGTRSDDVRRVRDLAIAAKNIEGWPASATQIGRSNLYHHGVSNRGHALSDGPIATVWLHHPELGEFQVKYEVRSAPTSVSRLNSESRSSAEASASCKQDVVIVADRMTVTGAAFSDATQADSQYYRKMRNASWFRPAAATSGGSVCFSIAELDLKKVTSVPKGFEHLMLARISSAEAKIPAAGAQGGVPRSTGEDGAIVAHIGDNRLPIRALGELPDVRPQMLAMAGALAQAAGAKMPAERPDAKRARLDALEPLDSTVAGTGYRFYFHPVTLNDDHYWLVGTVRDDAQTATLGRLGPRILTFALALALLAALTPTLKLALLGPVDGIKPIEAGALVFGLLAAVALATTALMITADVISVRNAVALRLSQSVVAIRMRTVDEMHRILLGEKGSLIAPLAALVREPVVTQDASAATQAAPTPTSLIKSTSARPAHLRNYPQPDSIFPIGRDGRLADGMTLAVARDMSGAGFELADRPYFQRVVNGDFAPGSEALVDKLVRANITGLSNCITGGLVFEQLRSRPDGVPKTIVAARMKEGCTSPPTAAGEIDPDEMRGRAQVLGVSMVLKSLLSPPLHEGEQFAVLDANKGVAGLPVLFHSERGRANVEPFAEALDGAARRGLASAAASPAACARAPAAGDYRTFASLAPWAETFSGRYEGKPTLFAATRLPCTDWIAVTFIPRDLVDSYAAMAGTHAVQIWIGLLILAIAALAIVNWVKWAVTGRPAWLWLWPDPAKRDRYLRAILPLAVVAFLTAIVGCYGSMPSLAALLGPPLAVATLYAAVAAKRDPLGRLTTALVANSARGSPVSSPAQGAGSSPQAPASPAAAPRRPDVLDAAMEWRVSCIIALMVLCVAVLPVVALGRDARTYFDAQQIGDDFEALRLAREEERRGIEAVALTYRKDARSAVAPARDRVSLLCISHPGDARDFGLFVFSSRAPCFNDVTLGQRSIGWSLTAALRRVTLGMDKHSRFGDPRLIIRPGPGLNAGLFLVALALALSAALAFAFRSALQGLFGFGVVLEAVPYPGLPMGPSRKSTDLTAASLDLEKLPARFIAVAAPDYVLRLLDRQTRQPVDLFRATDRRAPAIFPPATTHPANAALLLFKNLEMLMRNRERRLKALAIFERYVADQASNTGGHRFTIGLITDLSPLDRLLQSYERDAEELERLDPQQRHVRRAELAGEREDVRWSRLFESFTTYTYRARARDTDKGLPLTAEERAAVDVVEREVAYLPDHVVAAIIPDHTPLLLEPREVALWATSLKGSSPRAIVDYLCSQLVEHYQLAWSVSSHAERLLLHRYAHGQLVNIKEAYALRSLVRRGLVVLDPVPRIMNRSFAQFVRHCEEPETLARWRKETRRSAWQALGTPLMLALPFALGVVAVIAIRSGESVAALLPFVVSVGPALVNFLSGNRRVAA